MLDSTTKQKIDSLRNLLVGKVPDPKSQVEQITIALFYKFMWDRDKEIKDLGGNATFFIDEFEKYSWENLFAQDLGGAECIKLYGEAIEEMENNPNIPSIFREIFKRAFLPYNDPHTLRLFLEEINDFHYSDSEKLGDGFEYLISILGTQGDAGQFRTPRHIIDFIVEIVNPQKRDRICDPACGTAGFVISAYKHILKTNTKETAGDLLTPEDRKRLGNNLLGLDIDPMMVKLALANMYLHGLNEPHIYEYDSLTSEKRWSDPYDVMLANPPFMTPTGGIRPHKKFAVNATKAEVLFTSYINTHLSNNGRAGIIVPEGIIFQSANAYKDLRKQLIESSLIGVISLGFYDIYLNNINLESKLKSLEVSNHVSLIAEIPKIRKYVVKIQKSFQNKGGLVMDGRDIGSVVFPNADLKLFLTASDNVRAKRRYDELINEGYEINYEDIFNNIISRDKKDSKRKDSPLIIPKDAVVIDNSKMNIADQLNFIIKLIKTKFNF